MQYLFVKSKLKMQTQLSTFGNMLDSFSSQLREVASMRKLIDEELLEVQNFYNNKSNMSSCVAELIQKNVSQGIIHLLKQFQYYQVETSVRIIEQVNDWIEKITRKYSTIISEKDNELHKNQLVIRSLKQEIALMKIKHSNQNNLNLNNKSNDKRQVQHQNKQNLSELKNTELQSDYNRKQNSVQNDNNLNNIRSVFKLQKLTTDNYQPLSDNKSASPFGLIRTVFLSPQLQQSSLSLKQEELIQISHSSIKKATASLFFDFDASSKKKQLISLIPFSNQNSKFDDSLDNEDDVFAKLTFGKNKVSCFKQQEVQVMKEDDKRGKFFKPDHNNIFSKRKELSNQKQNNNKRLLLEISPQNLNNQIYLQHSQQQSTKQKTFNLNKYMKCLKNTYLKQNNSKNNQDYVFYLGDPTKQVKYEGLKRDGKKFGRGILKYSDGLEYEGEFEDNKREGFGTLRLRGFEIYSGDWLDDMIHGEGRLRNCEYIRNKMPKIQKIEQQYSAWTSYIGSFKENSFNGQGELYTQNGYKLIGSFRKGKIEGEGTIYKSNGQVRFGQWRNNKFVEEY